MTRGRKRERREKVFEKHVALEMWGPLPLPSSRRDRERNIYIERSIESERVTCSKVMERVCECMCVREGEGGEMLESGR